MFKNFICHECGERGHVSSMDIFPMKQKKKAEEASKRGKEQEKPKAEGKE